tara:strand:- start:2359 stop:5208 length:2850 start_codon:yes stop_codon:yes gene_type:complete
MIQFIKRLFNTDKYNESSIKLIEGMGRHGAKQYPFDQRAAVRAFHSWVYAAANINAQACAATPLRLYMRNDQSRTKLFNTKKPSAHRKSYLLGDGPGNAGPSVNTIRKMNDLGTNFEEITDSHPLIDMLSTSNKIFNGFDLTMLRILYGELTGNAYMAVIWDQGLGIPTELWPMPSQWTWIVPDREEFIKGYVYASPGNEQLEYAPDEVIHFKRPNPNDLFYGMGKVEAAWGTVSINQSIHEMDLATYENHARPDYAVVVKNGASGTTLDRFEQHVNDRLRGNHQAGKFLTMTGDVTLTPLNFPPKDLTGREEVVEEISAVFGVPVSLMKANDPNLASARVGYSQWREGTILPLLRMDEDVLNQVLLPMFGLSDDAVLAYDNPVPDDEAFKLQETQTAVAGGWMSINEARATQGLEPFDNELADQPLINGMPLGAQAQPMGLDGDLGDYQLSMGQEKATDTIESFSHTNVSNVMKILENVSKGTLTIDSAIELIAATGIPIDRAKRMVGSQALISSIADSDEQEIESNSCGCDKSSDDCISDKVSILIEEGYSEEQATAIAYRMCENTNKQQATPTAEEETAEVIQEEVEYFATPEAAEEEAERLGCEGYHTHTVDGQIVYMPCESMEEYEELSDGQKCGCEYLADQKTIKQSDLYDWDSPINIKEATPSGESYSKLSEELIDEIKSWQRKMGTVLFADISKIASKIAKANLDLTTMGRIEARKALREILGSSMGADLAKQISGQSQKPIQMIQEAGAAKGINSMLSIGASGIEKDKLAKQTSGALKANLDKYTAKISRSVAGTTSKRVTKIIKDGISQGKTTDEIAKDIRDWNGIKGDYESGSYARAKMIARTETARAYGEGAITSYENSGVVSGKKWLLAPNACEYCRAASHLLEKRGTTNLRDPFFEKGYQLKVAGKPPMILDYESVQTGTLHPNCRCDMIPEIST